MRILYIAVHEMNRGWGAETFVNKGFLSRGHETICVDYRRNRTRLAEIFTQLPDFDVLFLQRGDGFPIPLLQACRRPKVFWASELVARRRDQDRLFASKLFDHTFVHSPNCLETVVSRGWIERENLSVLLNGFDSSLHYRAENQSRDIDVLFIGSMTPRRKQLIDQIGRKVVVTVKRAFGKDMADLFRRAKIVLNIHAAEALDVETRVFEAMGCGALVLTEPLDTFSPFKHDQHLYECSVDEMPNQISRLLKNEKDLDRLANSGHLEAVQRHSYKARAGDIARVLQSCVELKKSSGPAFIW